jgi:hypothetical protein
MSVSVYLRTSISYEAGLVSMPWKPLSTKIALDARSLGKTCLPSKITGYCVKKRGKKVILAEFIRSDSIVEVE